jgi:methyl-accepting chemotaxis protein
MARFRNLPIRWKLIGGFGVVLLLMAGIGLVGINKLGVIEDLADTAYSRDTVGLAHVMQANIDLVASGRAEKNASLADDRAAAERHAESARRFLASATTNLDKFETTVALQSTRDKLASARTDLAAPGAGREKVLALALEGKNAEAKAEAEAVRQVADRVDATMGEFQESKLQLGVRSNAEMSQTYESARALMFGAVALAVVLGVGIAFYFGQTISSAAREMMTAAQRIAVGEINQTVTVPPRTSSARWRPPSRR